MLGMRWPTGRDMLQVSPQQVAAGHELETIHLGSG